MITQQIPSTHGGFDRKDRKQRRRSPRLKAGLDAHVATLIIAAGLFAACSSAGDDTQVGATGSSPTPDPSSSVDAPEPGPYVFKTDDSDFDAKYRITMDLLDGYRPVAGNPVVLGTDGGQGISAWTVGNVYAEPCRWAGTLLDPPIDPSVGGLVAGLASQKTRHASVASDVTLSGFTGKFMELTVPARIDLADCHDGQFRTWVDPTLDGARWLEPGQRDLLWIVDVDGSRLVIDAALGPKTTRQDRADRIQMVESIRIEPV
jgi:hypothetical protein